MDDPTTIEGQIACAGRELGMRRRVYPKWVEADRMTEEKAFREIAGMEAILATLHRIKEERSPQAKLGL